MESTFNNTPHVGNTSNSSPKRNTGASASSYSAGSTGSSAGSSSVGSSSLGSSADQVSNKPGNFVDKVKNIDVQSQINMLRDQSGVAYDYTVDYVKQNPMLAIGGAALVGFFAGMLFCRK